MGSTWSSSGQQPSDFTAATTAELVLAKFPDSVRGKTALVTGANSGIGKETARVLALGGATVLLASRNEKLGQDAVKEIQAAIPGADVRWVKLDLADQAQIRAFSNALIADRTPLSILVNNAGIMACPLSRTKDGFETQFGVNHLGHFALTKRLLPLLKANAPARIVNLSSSAPWNFEPPAAGEPADALYPPLDAAALNFTATDTQPARPYNAWDVYGYAKFANLLHAKELARRLGPADGVTAYSLNPGNIPATNLSSSASDLWNLLRARPLWLGLIGESLKSIPQGAATTLFCAIAPASALVNGGYYWFFAPCAAYAPRRADDPELSRRLWEVSEAMLAPFFAGAE